MSGCAPASSSTRFTVPPADPPGYFAARTDSVEGMMHLLERRSRRRSAVFLKAQEAQGPSDALSSALSRRTIDRVSDTGGPGTHPSNPDARNQWMFRVGHPDDQPLRVRPELTTPRPIGRGFPICARVPCPHGPDSLRLVDIFFPRLPEGARV